MTSESLAPATDPAHGPTSSVAPSTSDATANRRATLLTIALLAGCALLLFRLSIFQGWTYIGDSDRLNTVLNVRLFEVNEIRAHGYVPAWNETQLMGTPITGLHWILPGLTPLPYLLALLPEASIFRALAAVSAVLLALTIVSGYLALRAYTASTAVAAVGGLLYGLSSYALIRIAQFDLSCLVLVVGPLMLMVIRSIERQTAVRSFLWLTLGWAVMFWLTFLQEAAYVSLLLGLYATYRSVRLGNRWPFVVAALAGAIGVVIGLPRVVTVGMDVAELSRASGIVQTRSVEALRFFGDGLLGRYFGEQFGTLAGSINLHEGIQLLGSALASLAAIMAGLLSRSRTMRILGVALVIVLSMGFADFGRAVYGIGLDQLPYPSLELRAILLNGVIFGVPLWLLTRWLAGRRALTPVLPSGSTRAVGLRANESPATAAEIDGPFFLGFVIFMLAVVLIPEANTLLYYASFKADFTHARMSVATILPLAALTTIFLGQFVPARLPALAARWLAGGAVVGLVLWGGRELVASAVVGGLGVVFDAQPWHLLTLEVVRVATSLIAVVVAVAMLVSRGGGAARLAAVTGALLAWMALETLLSADFKLAGPHTREQAVPFQANNQYNAPPDTLRPPSASERAAVRDRLETDAYRTVFYQDRADFPVLIESHMAAFWDVRLIEGYPSFTRRMGLLPWMQGMTTQKHLDIYAATVTEDLPWRLLAALNVKYLVTVDRSFWSNPGPGAAEPPFDLARLKIEQNPFPVTPRVFFTARVTQPGSALRFLGDSGVRPVPKNLPIREPATQSMVEGIPQERRFSTAGAISSTFAGDRIQVRVEPSNEERFLVLNEMYHPSWRAWIDGQPAEIYPTNIVMRGLLVPAGATTIELRYIPFLVSWPGIGLLAAGVSLAVVGAFGLRRITRRLPI